MVGRDVAMIVLSSELTRITRVRPMNTDKRKRNGRRLVWSVNSISSSWPCFLFRSDLFDSEPVTSAVGKGDILSVTTSAARDGSSCVEDMAYGLQTVESVAV